MAGTPEPETPVWAAPRDLSFSTTGTRSRGPLRYHAIIGAGPIGADARSWCDPAGRVMLLNETLAVRAADLHPDSRCRLPGCKAAYIRLDLGREVLNT